MKSLIAFSFGRLLLIAVLIFSFGCEEGLEPLDEGMDIAPLSNTVRDCDYGKRLCFFLENPGSSFDNPMPGFGTLYPVYDKLPDTEPIEVYVSLRLDLNEPQIYDGAIYYIDAYTDPENNGLGDNVGIDSLWSSIFKKLSWGDEYNLIWNYQEHRIIGIFLSQPLDDKRALAVCYRATDGVSEFDVGDYDTSLGWDKYNPRLAELICPPSDEFGPDSFSSFFPSTWKMMMRNVYELGIHDVDPVLIPDIVNIRIEDRSLRPNRSVVADPSGISYLRIFGLDSYDRQGNLKKDGRVDNIPGIIFANSGHIMFPWPEPFNPPQRVIEDILDPGDPEELLFEYDELIRNGVLYDTLVWCGNDDAAHTYSIIVEWPNVDVKDPPDR